MKKLLASLCLTLAATGTWAIPDRVFELGFDVNAGLGNSYFTFDDFFQETLVIDLNEIAASLTNDGLAFSSDAKVGTTAQLNLSRDFQLGFHLLTAASGYSSVPKAFFDLAANGNQLDKTYEAAMNLRGDVTTELGATFGTRLFGADAHFGASFFIPVFHLEKPKAQYTFRTDGDGKVTAEVDADLPIYSVVPLQDGLKPTELLAKLFTVGGLDFSVGAQYPLFPDLLLVGADLKNVPLWPAQMVERTRLLYQATFSATDIAGNYNTGTMTQQSSSSSFLSDKAAISVLRPFKANTHAVYMPLGMPLIKVIPSLGLGYYTWLYPEFGLKAQLDVWKWLVLELGTSYEDQLWRQRLGLNVNLWLVELDLAVAGQSQDIGRSFGSGLNASVGLKLGF